jgi:hypothetical protein
LQTHAQITDGVINALALKQVGSIAAGHPANRKHLLHRSARGAGP